MRSAWTDDNLWWLVLAGAAWLVQRIKTAQKKAARTRPGAGPRAAPDEAEERMRRVQEEIRRRIEERRSGRMPAPALPREAPPPIRPRSAPAAPAWPPRPGPESPEPESIGPKSVRAPNDIPSLFQPSASADSPPLADSSSSTGSGESDEAAPPAVDDLAKKLRAQEAAEAAALVREQLADIGATDLTLARPAASAEPARPVGAAAELRDPASARRAIVLREILGPPIGLR